MNWASNLVKGGNSLASGLLLPMYIVGMPPLSHKIGDWMILMIVFLL